MQLWLDGEGPIAPADQSFIDDIAGGSDRLTSRSSKWPVALRKSSAGIGGKVTHQRFARCVEFCLHGRSKEATHRLLA